MIYIYGVIGYGGGFVELSTNERSAKNQATRAGYETLYRRPAAGNLICAVHSVKVGSRWHNCEV